MSIRKAIGAVKDQTSIGITKVSSNTAPELKVAIVKATSHDDDPPDEKYIREVVNMVSLSDGYVHACVSALSKRLGKTRDWVVAIKTLMLVHRLLSDVDLFFHRELMLATRKGTRVLNMNDFREEAHANPWDHSTFVKTYALYLDQKLELMIFERKSGTGRGREMDREERWRSPAGRGQDYDYADYRNEPVMRSSKWDANESAGREERRAVTPLREMKPERIFTKMGLLQRLLDRVLACRPSGMAKNCRLLLVALHPVVRESFQLYADICEVLAVLLDKFFDMEYPNCVKAFNAYASAAKQIDELIQFYNWCKDVGVARTSEFPDVQRITNKLLETLEEFLRDRAKGQKSPERREAPSVPQPEEPEPDVNEIKALPAPEVKAPPPPPEPKPETEPQNQPQFSEDLVNLRDDGVTVDDQGNKFALALFAGPPVNENGSWQAFPSDGQSDVTSAWQNPAAEAGKADWELALVESASNLSKQKNEMGGGLDPLLLNGMYDQGMVRQHTSTNAVTGGSASSVALPGKSSTPVLALPAPDGTFQTVNQDPFAASLAIPPPSYVQMSDMENKQQLLTHEQQLWQQYASQGMQGPASLAKMSGQGYYGHPSPQMMPYGMPPGGHYYTG